MPGARCRHGAEGDHRHLRILDEITLCGDRLTLADIMLFAFLDFGAMVSQPINPDLKNIAAHHARMKGRPSAAA